MKKTKKPVVFSAEVFYNWWMKSKFIYESDGDMLTIEVDSLPVDSMNVMTSEPVEGVVFLELNQMSGGLLNICFRNVSDIAENLNNVIGKGPLKHDPESDTVTVELVPSSNQLSKALADIVHVDKQMQFLITLNRNKLGNLVALQIVGWSKLIQKHAKK